MEGVRRRSGLGSGGVGSGGDDHSGGGHGVPLGSTGASTGGGGSGCCAGSCLAASRSCQERPGPRNFLCSGVNGCRLGADRGSRPDSGVPALGSTSSGMASELSYKFPAKPTGRLRSSRVEWLTRSAHPAQRLNCLNPSTTSLCEQRRC